MSRRTVPLTVDHLDLLAQAGAPCRGCLFWQLDPVRRARLGDADGEAERHQEQDAWVSTVLREWGSCGRVALVDDVPVGWAVHAPAKHLAGSAQLPTAPVSADAVLMAMIWVAPGHRGGGIGRMLVQGVARDVVRRGGGAIEAFGDTRGGRERPERRACVVSAEFLGRVGFGTRRAHPTTPRMRMDLRTALSWREEVEAALGRVRGALRPSPAGTQMKSESSLSIAALGLAPTMDLTTSPPE